jgi:SAM-dependent methyltransferase
MSAPLHEGLAPSPWVLRWARLWQSGSQVLDVACGAGRHLRALAAAGHAVTGIDRDAEALAPLAGLGETLVADIESDAWPLPGRQFDAVVVTNYLWRPLMPTLLASVAAEGWLVYETFSIGQETIGKPSNPAFLLRPGELLDTVRGHAAGGWRVIAYEDGFLDAPDRFVQRIAARRVPAVRGDPPRYPL